MNAYHEANRRHWDAAAAAWRELRERDGLWKRCASEPELAFEGEALQRERLCPMGKRTGSGAAVACEGAERYSS